MLLTVDVGNTEVTTGLFQGTELLGRWRLTTQVDRTPDEWALVLESFVIRDGHAPAEVAACCVASVVPGVTQSLLPALHLSFGERIGLVEARAPLGLTLAVDEPLAMGADRIANALGALDRFPGDSVVIGFGTATTFNCITANRAFIGGSIMPGLRTSADQLIRRAAKLAATDLVAPTHAIGRTTDDNIRGGVLFGAADAADGMVRRILAEWPTSARVQVIATGGLAGLVAPLMTSVHAVDPDLTLHGVRVAAHALGLVP
ncbi:MAG TPA: type III pantothenate kinase [Gemmatimonadales bacterium]|jgi:type III pantothenate kinase